MTHKLLFVYELLAARLTLCRCNFRDTICYRANCLLATNSLIQLKKRLQHFVKHLRLYNSNKIINNKSISVFSMYHQIH